MPCARPPKATALLPDTEWQHEFEDSFEFNETEDQMNAIIDVKHDMESPTPMDRLLCGDVGYGKTEVAMRAAFKAVSDNRQVAVLAPTTVLAFQHYNTFRQRFAAFPIKIEMLSRFRTSKQQKEADCESRSRASGYSHWHTSRAFEGCEVHRSRFGDRRRRAALRSPPQGTAQATAPRSGRADDVGHAYSANAAHVATRAARHECHRDTAQRSHGDPNRGCGMGRETAALGDRERTGAWRAGLLRTQPGGEHLRHRQQAARDGSASAHSGRSWSDAGERLERVMLGFMRHEADILVATTIIENGLDIPLCNTIIINRADRHGLSELYQLRGRVGRSDRRAYAYLLIPPDRDLSELARRRLAALKEFSDLGAGFKIAALDLELRGAGNLLGGEQSGHVEAVGFELYTTMLERTVRELKGEIPQEVPEAQLNLGLNIRIPSDYIAEENQRLRMYKRVAGVESESQLEDVAGELGDRYGTPPEPVRNLLEYAGLKLLSQRIGVAQIERRRDAVSIRFSEKATVDPERLAQFVASAPGSRFTPAGVLKFSLKEKQPEQILVRLKSLLEQLEGEHQAVV